MFVAFEYKKTYNNTINLQNLMKQFVFFTIGLISFGFLLSACNTNNLKEDKKAQVEAMEKQLYQEANGIVNKKDAASMIDLYQDYANTFPQDSLSPQYLFRAADVSLNVFHSDATIRLFNRIMKDYPNFEGTPQLLFLKAFTYDYYMHKTDSAKIYYTAFLQKYPTHPFAQDAQISLQQLGKNPKEIVKDFQSKSKR